MLIKKILTISNTIRCGKTLALKKTCRASLIQINYYRFSQKNESHDKQENDQKLFQNY